MRRQATIRIGFAGLLLMTAVAGIALGIWQIQRREWKHALIAAVADRAFADPVAAPGPAEWTRLSIDGDAYRRVTLSGTFDHRRETLVRAVTDAGSGYWVLTPLITNRFTVIVNRGFVPPDRKVRATRAMGNRAGVVRVTGLLRFSEPGGGFLRNNKPEADLWYSRDIAAIAQSRKLGATAPYFVDADKSPNVGGYPIAGLTVLRFSDNHMTYALTWFAIASGCLWGFAMILRRP